MDGQQATTKDVIKLATELFHKHYKVSAENPTQGPGPFLQWVRDCDFLYSRWEVAEAAGVPPLGAWELFDATTGGPIEANLVLKYWPLVAMGDRPPLKNLPQSLHVVAFLRWDDGTLKPVSSVTPAHFNEDFGWSDGMTALYLQAAMEDVVRTVHEQGMDRLHDQTVYVGGDHAWLAFGNFVQQMIAFAPIEERLKEPVKNWAKLTLSVLNPDFLLPVDLKAAVIRRREQLRVAHEGRPEGGSPG